MLQFINDVYELHRSELAFMAEYYGIYLVLGIGLICLCVYAHFAKDDDDEL
jgi:cytochrome bd-type quinol oxidase subunit 1